MACVSQVKRILRLLSENVAKLKTELVSVVELSLLLFIFTCFTLFLVARVVFVVVDLTVEIDPVDNRSS